MRSACTSHGRASPSLPARFTAESRMRCPENTTPPSSVMGPLPSRDSASGAGSA